MARTNGAIEYSFSCKVFGKNKKGYLPSSVNGLVIKQYPNGRNKLNMFTLTIAWIFISSILVQKSWVKLINPKSLGPCAIVQGIMPSIFKVNNVYTCGTLILTALKLILKALASQMKSVGDLKFFFGIPVLGLNCVMSNSIIHKSFGTRSSKKAISSYYFLNNRSIKFKGAVISARSFTTSAIQWSIDEVFKNLDDLKKASKNNNISEVNKITKLLLGNTYY